MELHVYLAFSIATVIMIALPGPSVLLTVAHGISFGWRAPCPPLQERQWALPFNCRSPQ